MQPKWPPSSWEIFRPRPSTIRVRCLSWLSKVHPQDEAPAPANQSSAGGPVQDLQATPVVPAASHPQESPEVEEGRDQEQRQGPGRGQRQEKATWKCTELPQLSELHWTQLGALVVLVAAACAWGCLLLVQALHPVFPGILLALAMQIFDLTLLARPWKETDTQEEFYLWWCAPVEWKERQSNRSMTTLDEIEELVKGLEDKMKSHHHDHEERFEELEERIDELLEERFEELKEGIDELLEERFAEFEDQRNPLQEDLQKLLQALNDENERSGRADSDVQSGTSARREAGQTVWTEETAPPLLPLQGSRKPGHEEGAAGEENCQLHDPVEEIDLCQSPRSSD